MKNKENDAIQSNKIVNRCKLCNKKLNLSNMIKCKCNNIYCFEHRYQFTHNCTYDDKQEIIEKLTKENPVVINDKIEKI
uniref:AN1-type domain-containing protein n=1 Tax=viral metagenome TaxID=1070528 RepID=A0A6C0ECF7_9ZZZZ